MLIRTPQVAELLGVSERTVIRWRQNGEGPRYRRDGWRTVVYDIRDVQQYHNQTIRAELDRIAKRISELEEVAR